jgi:myosin heavy subunit
MAGELKREDLFDPNALIPVIKEARDLEDALKGILGTSKEILQNQPFKTGQDVKNYNQEAQKSITVAKELDKVEQQRLRLQAQLSSEVQKRTKEIERLKLQKREQNKETKDTIELENKEIGTLKRLQVENRKLRREREQLNLETAEGQTRLQEINATLDKNNEFIKENSDNLKKQRLNVGNYKEDIKEAAGELTIFGVNLGQLKRQFELYGRGLKGAVSSSNALIRSSKALKIALISTGIGAIVVALGGLIAAFASTQRGVDALTRITRPLQAIFQRLLGVIQELSFAGFDALKEAIDNPIEALKELGSLIVDNIINRFTSIKVFGEAIKQLFEGDFAGAAKTAADATLQLTTGVEDATDKIGKLAEATGEFVNESIRQGTELDETIKKLERLEVQFARNEQRLRRTFEERKSAADDANLSDQERIESAQQAQTALRELASQEIELIDLRIKAKKIELGFNDTLIAESKELAELEAQRDEVAARTAREINEVRNKQTTIEQKQFNDQKKALGEIQTIERITLDTTEELAKAQEKVTKATEERSKEVQESIKQEAAAREKANQEYIEQEEAKLERTKAVINDISSSLTVGVNKEIEENQRRTEAANEEIQRQQELADKGQKNNLAEAQRNAAELEAERQRLARKQQNRELAQSFLNAYNNLLKDPQTDPGQALQKALGQTALAKASLTLFGGSAYEGVEDTGGPGTLDSKGGKWWKLHPHERVLTAEQNAKLKGLSNEDVVKLATHGAPMVQQSFGEKHIKQLIRAIEKNKSESHFNLADGVITEKQYRNGAKRIIKHVRRRPRLG